MWRAAFALGHTQAWLAGRIRNDTTGLAILLLPAWAITRLTFISLYTYCCWWTLRNT